MSARKFFGLFILIVGIESIYLLTKQTYLPFAITLLVVGYGMLTNKNLK